jgi:hypothetical protein
VIVVRSKRVVTPLVVMFYGFIPMTIFAVSIYEAGTPDCERRLGAEADRESLAVAIVYEAGWGKPPGKSNFPGGVSTPDQFIAYFPGCCSLRRQNKQFMLGVLQIDWAEVELKYENTRVFIALDECNRVIDYSAFDPD